MTRYKILVVGTSESLQSARASELLGFLSSQGEAPVCLSNAADYRHDNYDLMFVVAPASGTSSLEEWVAKVKAGELSVRTLVLYDEAIPESWREVLDPEIEIGDEHALVESIDYLFEGDMAFQGDSGSLSLSPDSNVGNPITFDVGPDVVGGLSLDSDDSGLSVDLSGDPSESTQLFEDSPVPGDDLHTELFNSDKIDDELNLDSLDYNSDAMAVSAEEAVSGFEVEESSAAALLGADLGEVVEDDIAISVAASDEGAVDLNAVEESDVEYEMFSSGPIAESSDDLSEDDLALNLESSDSVESKIEHPDSDISAPLAGRDTFAAEIKEEPIIPSNDSLFDAGLDFEAMANETAHAASMVDPALSTHLKSEDIATVQKYAAMKEREAREKDATVRVLKGQMAKLEAKLTQDVQERRRLSLLNDDLQSQVNSYEEELSQKQFHIQKMEGTHQEELRALSLRLDNAIFQANKAQNKLEDFRERVRGDFVKIRAQERELYNKLELQKRDAEALLASKDEQLLDQRREIDRLHYELDGLRERMVEETEKAEDRSARIKRATQSLKLANDLLSGLAEEVLPSASDRDVPMTGFEKGDDAA